MSVLAGKIALVTGASAGIGLAVSRKLAAQGVKVAMVARTEKALREAAAQVGGEPFPLDVEDLPKLAALPQRVVDRLGALDIVVNNAGVHHRGAVLAVEPLALAEMVTVNLAAPIVLCRAAIPLLRPGGSIVNVASLSGMVPMPFQAAYGASKAGLRAFSRALRDELQQRGISVSVVSPGPVDTGFFDKEADKIADATFSQPLSSADQVADAVLRCLEERSAEVALPWFSGKLATLGYLSPALTRALRPFLETRGAKAKRAFLERRRNR
jgi:short-subunit dehydrogenase